MCTHRARLALLDGRLDDAERLVAEARAMGEEVQSWNANVTYRLQLYALRRAQGRLDEILDLLRRSGRGLPDVSDLPLRRGADRGSRRAHTAMRRRHSRRWLRTSARRSRSTRSGS